MKYFIFILGNGSSWRVYHNQDGGVYHRYLQQQMGEAAAKHAFLLRCYVPWPLENDYL